MESTVLENTDIKVELSTASRLPSVDLTTAAFGNVFSDHMFVVDYLANEGWQEPSIMPYGHLSMSPSVSGLHYGQTIFEGMKAMRDRDGNINLFRPLDHLNRFNYSAQRLCMPPVPEDLFIDGLRTLVDIDHGWVPGHPGGALYIRPVLFATDEFLGMRPSLSYRLVIMTLPVNLYYSKPLKVWVTDRYVRASPGGIGDVKTAGNYARALSISQEAIDKGYNVVLWLDAFHKKFIEEYSTMNAFFVVDNFVITPKITGTFLEGITRDSVIKLLKHFGYKIYERDISIDEIMELGNTGDLKEAFGTGTAAVVAPVSEFQYHGQKIQLGPTQDWKIFNMLYQKISQIRSRHEPDYFNWLVSV